MPHQFPPHQFPPHQFPPHQRTQFVTELCQLLNRQNIEPYSNTPDFILAQLLLEVLGSFEAATRARDQWFGRKLGTDGFFEALRQEAEPEFSVDGGVVPTQPGENIIEKLHAARAEPTAVDTTATVQVRPPPPAVHDLTDAATTLVALVTNPTEVSTGPVLLLNAPQWVRAQALQWWLDTPEALAPHWKFLERANYYATTHCIWLDGKLLFVAVPPEAT